MGFKDILNRMKEKREEKKSMIRRMEEQDRAETILSERKLSANERELNKIFKEQHEVEIKDELEFQRKKRSEDISFNHNILDTPNIMHSDWCILKERNQFADNRNILANNKFVHQDNPNLFKNNPNLFGI